MRWSAWLFVLALMIADRFVHAQEVPQPTPVMVPAIGTEALRGILKREGLEPLTNPNELYRDPQSTILIVLGSTNHLRGDGLRQFVRAGGAILIASNSPAGQMGAFDWADSLGIVLGRETLKSIRADDCFRGKSRDPFIDGDLFYDEMLPETSPENLFHGLQKIATRDPTFIVALPIGPFQPIAGFYPSIRTQITERRLARDQQAFAVGAEIRTFLGGGRDISTGRILVLGDHNVFNNAWILPADNQSNDNFDFTNQCIRWLNPQKQRTKCVFFHDGVLETNFNVTIVDLPSPPLPPIPVMANMLFQHGNKIIADFEDRDWFNERMTRRLNYDRFLRNVILVATIALAAYGVYRLWRAQSTNDALIPPRLGKSDEPPSRTVSIESRHESLIDRNNLYESAAMFLRERLASLGIGSPDNHKPPRIVCTGTFWERSRTRRLFGKVWNVAYGRHPVVVSSSGWLKLADEMTRLETAFERGHWSLPPTVEGTA